MSALTRVIVADPMERGHHVDYAAGLTRALAGSGVQVHLVGSKHFTEAVASRGSVDHGTIVSYQHGKGPRAEVRKARFLTTVAELVHRDYADIAHLLFLDRFVIALRKTHGRFGNVPVVGTLHWSYLSRNTPQSLVNALVRRLERRCLRGVLARGGRVMVHGRSTAASLAAEIKFPAFDYVPYPVARPHRDGMTQEAARRYLALPSDGRILLAFGATRFDKGADVAVASLTDLPRDVHLVVAGRPTDFTRADLERRAQAQGTSNRLHVRAGFIADDDVSAYFAASNVVLAPYRRQFTGQSGPVTIAATMAIPVVATDADVLRETVSEYGLGEVCRPEDPSALAAAVRRVLDRRPVPEAERFVREHDLTAFGDAVRASYHKALRAARTRT